MIRQFTDESTGLRVRVQQGDTDRALLLIHGLGGGLSNWTLVQRALGPRVRSVAVELPWHGASVPRSPVDSVEDLLDLVARTALGAHDGEFVAVGHSLGAAVALGLAGRSPRRMNRVVLISGHLFTLSDLITGRSPRTAHSKLRIAWWRAFAAASTPMPPMLARRLGTSARLQRLMLPPFFNPRLLALDGSLGECLADHHGRGPGRLLRLIRRRPLSQLAASCPVPVVLVGGGQDPLLRPDDARRAHQLLTVERYEHHAECAHWIIVERPSATAGLLRALCEQV